MINKIIEKIKEDVVSEATSEMGSRGSYNPPLRPGLRKWLKNSNAPFTEELSEFINAENYYDSLDGKMSKNNKNRSTKEKHSKSIRNKDYKINSKDEGDDEYAYGKFKVEKQKVNLKKKKGKKNISEWIEITEDTDIKDVINESTASVTSGPYNGPMELGLKKWKNSLSPFDIDINHHHNKTAKKSKLKNNVLRTVGVWEKNSDGSYHNPTHDAGGKKINEDLAVWFGTKKKPKGSNQPKGPWVNICRKKEGGGHPPCGRPEATDKGYPKCRAAGVAARMSDSQKRAACAQKRRAEKTNPKSGTGNSPKMVSYKPRKTNENMKKIVRLTESDLMRIVKRIISEQHYTIDDAEYFFKSGFRNKQVYLTKNEDGDYEAFQPSSDPDVMENLGVLPSEDMLGFIVNPKDGSVIGLNDSTKLARELGVEVENEMGQVKKTVMYVDSNNIPCIGSLSFGTMKKEILLDLQRKNKYTEVTADNGETKVEVLGRQFILVKDKAYTVLLSDKTQATKMS